MAYLSFDKPVSKFKILDYTGNAAANVITGVGFAPAFSWFKSTSNTNSHAIFNTLMTTYSVSPNGNAAQYNGSGDGFTSLDSDGFTFNGSGGGGGTNASGFGYRSWNWIGGTTAVPSGSDVTVDACDINVAAGMGMYKYTGNNTVGAILKHGLGRTPQFIMIKNIDTATTDWACYHAKVDTDLTQAGDYFLRLNTTAARSNNDGYFADSVTTDTDIVLGADTPVNQNSQQLIMFAFCNVPGFSHMGSYYGTNRTSGQFVYTGFKPSFIMIKAAAGVEGWNIFDNLSNPVNVANKNLMANTNAAVATNGSAAGDKKIDILSNGFRIDSTSTELSPDGGNMIYAAFAEHPLVSNNGKAATAR